MKKTHAHIIATLSLTSKTLSIDSIKVYPGSKIRSNDQKKLSAQKIQLQDDINEALEEINEEKYIHQPLYSDKYDLEIEDQLLQEMPDEDNDELSYSDESDNESIYSTESSELSDTEILESDTDNEQQEGIQEESDNESSYLSNSVESSDTESDEKSWSTKNNYSTSDEESVQSNEDYRTDEAVISPIENDTVTNENVFINIEDKKNSRDIKIAREMKEKEARRQLSHFKSVTNTGPSIPAQPDRHYLFTNKY